jgi:MFS family permease
MQAVVSAARKLRGDIRGRAVWVVLGCLVCQVGLGYGYVYGPLLKDITADLDWTRAMYSSARAPLLLVTAFSSPFVGLLAERFGPHRVLTSAVLLLGVPFLIISRMEALWQFYAANVVLGLVTTGLGDITVGAAVSQWVVRGRGLALGVVYTGSNLAGAVLSPTAVWLAQRGSWRSALFWIGIGGAVLLLPFAAWVVRSPRPGEEPHVAVDAGEPELHVEREDDLDLRAALRTRSFWLLAVALFCFFFYFLGILEHMVAALTDRGLEASEAARLYGFAIGLGIVSKIVMGLIADRIPHKGAALVDYALLALSSLLLIWVPRSGVLQVFLVTYGFSVAARDVIYPLIIVHSFGVRNMASIYGALMLVLAPAGTLGSIFPAAVYDRTGTYDLAFVAYAVVNVIVLASLFFVRNERTAAQPGPC